MRIKTVVTKQITEKEISEKKRGNVYKPRDIDSEIFDKLKIKNMKLYTDGGCRVHSDDKPGSHACIVVDDDNKQVMEYSSSVELNTTNNVQEIKAMTKAIELIRKGGWQGCTVYTDSEYVKKGLTEWCKAWKRNKWRTSTNKPVKNKDLWIYLFDLYNLNGGKIEVKWVKAHDGNEWNEAVDQLCTDIVEDFINE